MAKFEKGGEYAEAAMYEDEQINYTELNARNLEEYYIAKYIDHNAKKFKKIDTFAGIRRLRKVFPERIYYMQELEFTFHPNWNSDDLYTNSPANESF